MNETNKRFYNKTGFIRCLTDEINEKQRRQNPNLGTRQDFEDWLAPLIKDYKSNKVTQKETGKLASATYTIPLVFHIVTGTAGDANDLDQAFVNAQVDQLNIDFSNAAGAATGPWAAVAAGINIQFVLAQIDPMGNVLAEPGIDRVYGYPGEINPDFFDETIKPVSFWDNTLYANVWTGKLEDDLLGYAQFPNSSTLSGLLDFEGDFFSDGVVCLPSSIGSVAMPNPDGAEFGSGRTLTHELGHWLGLLHIWGTDGDCSADDECADTPSQLESSSGCSITNDTCTMDSNRDMVENYMDYSDDTCMNIFTADQVARMITVLENSPGRMELNDSATANTSVSVNFIASSVVQPEGSDCNFTDINIPIVIGSGASSNTDVTFAISGASAATPNVDFELMNTNVSFPSGSVGPQNITLRIFNDGFVEGDETFTIDLTVNPNGGDALAGTRNSLMVTIVDDEFTATELIEEAIYTEDFSTGLGGVTTIDADGAVEDNWGVVNFEPSGFFAYNGNFAFSSSWLDDVVYNPDNYLVTPQITIPAGSTNVKLKYLVGSGNNEEFLDENYEVYISSSATTTADILAGTRLADENLQDFLLFSGSELKTFDITAFAGQSIYVSFRHHDSSDNNLLGIDDISITKDGNRPIETEVKTETFNLTSIGGIVYAYNSTLDNENIIADFNITDNSEYGCTTVELSRSGNASQLFNGGSNAYSVTDKAFTITPTTTNSSGTSTMAFYFTEEELAGWETGTGDSRSNLLLIKDNGSNISTVPTTITPFAAGWRLEGDFNDGLAGTYYFGRLGLALGASEFTFDAFAMYPNPSNNEFTIKFNTTNNVAIDLFDINGRMVLSKTFKNQVYSFNQNLNVSALAGGIYIVKIKSGSNTMFRKLVIN